LARKRALLFSPRQDSARQGVFMLGFCLLYRKPTKEVSMFQVLLTLKRA